jgi:large subunit ribosomal protein L3
MVDEKEKNQDEEVKGQVQESQGEETKETKKEVAQKTEESSQEKETPSEEKTDEVAKESQEPIKHEIRGMLGRKLGMTQVFDKDGNVVPVTIVEAGPCMVVELQESPTKVKLGFDTVSEKKLDNARLGLFKKAGVSPKRFTREFFSKNNEVYKVGMEIKADVFRVGDFLDVTGTSIGKGFQGGMKRHNWSGGPAGHGSRHHRRVGSIGASAYPARVVKGFPMPGQMGNKRVTTQGLKVIEVDLENNIVLLAGAVPGHKNSLIAMNISQKKAWKDPNEVKVIVKHKVNPMKQSKAAAGKKKG